MTVIKRYGLLLAGLVAIGCGQDQPTKAVPKVIVPDAQVVVATHSAAGQSTATDQSLLVEQVVDGRRIDPFTTSQAKALVLIFVSTDCPIANRYSPELRRLYEAYKAKNTLFWLVYSDPSATSEAIRQHLHEYDLPIPALRDSEQSLAQFCEATRTPEAVVFVGRNRQYRGRIDDRFIDYGKAREFASQHDLQDAIDAVLAGRKVPTPVTKVVGCPIPGIAE